MKFLDVIKVTCWSDVENYYYMSHYFRNRNRSDRLRKKVIKKYKAPFDELHRLTPITSNMRLVISKPEEGSYVNVSGLDGALYGQEEHFCADTQASLADVEIPYSLVGLEWEKWLGLEIAQETLDVFSKTEIAAHCIWEMTFCSS